MRVSQFHQQIFQSFNSLRGCVIAGYQCIVNCQKDIKTSKKHRSEVRLRTADKTKANQPIKTKDKLHRLKKPPLTWAPLSISSGSGGSCCIEQPIKLRFQRYNRRLTQRANHFTSFKWQSLPPLMITTFSIFY